MNHKTTKTKALIALALVCFFWGTTWIASREGVKHMPALQLAAIRQLAGGILYVAFFLGKGRVLPRGREWITVLILSFLNFMLSNGFSTWGVKYISGGLGALIGSIFPLWIVIIGLFSSKERMPAKAIVGLLLGFTGICVIFYEHLHDFLNSDFLLGIILSFIATWSWAFGTIYTKRQATEFNPYFSLGLQMLFSGIVLYSVCAATGMTVPLREIPWQSWTAIGYLTIFSSIVSFVAFLYALQHLPTGQVSIYAYINPIVAVLIGSLFFDESFTPYIAAGGAIILLGVYLVNEAFKKKGANVVKP
jgi:drug/metabolite transporter (DMT)-like permease